MDIKVFRNPEINHPTMGQMWIDGQFFCYTLEDIDRGLTDKMSEDTVKGKKVYGKTAIPSGTYKVILNQSEKFKRLLPLVIAVTGFEGIRIHRGNFEADTLGCIIVGYGLEGFSVTHSKQCEIDLVAKLKNAVHKLTISNKIKPV